MLSKLSSHINKNNLHHAYLIEGEREEIVPEIKIFLNSLGVETSGNPDFYHIAVDSFKIDDARNLKSQSTEKGFSPEKNAKKVFLISANNVLLEAQNTMLKMFEEPIENTHFFLIVPDASALLKTFISRFYLISTRVDQGAQLKDAEKFLAMPLRNRIDFLKELLSEEETDEETISNNSARSKALNFLNALEVILHDKKINISSLDYFRQIFKAREFIRQPGSSAKNLMESVALLVPNF